MARPHTGTNTDCARPRTTATCSRPDGTRRVTRKAIPEVAAEAGLVVEDPASGFCGAVVAVDIREVTLEDRRGGRRVFPLRPAAFLVEGAVATLVVPRERPETADRAPRRLRGRRRARSRSPGTPARTARAARIWVEGPARRRAGGARVGPRPAGGGRRRRADARHGRSRRGRRRRSAPVRSGGLGILVDHLVAGTKETRAAQQVAGPHVLVTGHPYVDVWEAVKPADRRHPGLAAGPARHRLEDRGLRGAALGRARGRRAARAGCRAQLPGPGDAADRGGRAAHRLRDGLITRTQSDSGRIVLCGPQCSG